MLANLKAHSAKTNAAPEAISLLIMMPIGHCEKKSHKMRFMALKKSAFLKVLDWGCVIIVKLFVNENFIHNF